MIVKMMAKIIENFKKLEKRLTELEFLTKHKSKFLK